MSELRGRVEAFYTASKTKHAHIWRYWRQQGFAVTSSWIDEAGEGQTDDYTELSSRCLREISRSSFLLLYCEEGEILKGALIEAGMAIALGVPVRCVGSCPSISRVFRKHPLWSEYGSIESAILEADKDE